MRKITGTVFACFILLSVGGVAVADGFLIGRGPHPSEAEQQALVYYSGGIEELIISPRFEGDALDFAWVIPVPSRPRVRSIDRAIFTELETLRRQTRDSGGRMGGGGYGGGPGAPGSVRVIERKQVGAYDVTVLQAGDPRALVAWLRGHGYALPREAEAPAAEHVREGWTFVAARVSAPETAQGLRTGMLAPIRLTFPASLPIYPMRMSAINPDRFQIAVYVALPARRSGGSSIVMQGPDGRRPTPLRPFWSGTPTRPSTPALASIIPEAVDIALHQDTLSPSQCRRDLTFLAAATSERPARTGVAHAGRAADASAPAR